MIDKIKENWEKILLILKEEHEVSDVSYRTWLQPLTPYSFKGNKFTRIAVLNKVKKEMLNEEAAEMNKMIFASSNYIVKYHFAKPVKKVSNTSALFSEDRKTVTLHYPFSEYMENPEKLNLEVEF